MNRPRSIRIVLCLVVVLVLGLLAFGIFRVGEPRYQGRTLTEWIKVGDEARDKFIIKNHGVPFDLKSDPDWHAAHDAMIEMVPDAVPCLLAWIQAKDSPRKIKMIDWLQGHRFTPFRIKRENYYHTMAYLGFRLLGDGAKSVQPGLIQLARSKDPECQSVALSCLHEGSPDKEALRPLLLQLIHAPDRSVQANALLWFRDLYPQDPEMADIYKSFPILTNLPAFQAITNQLGRKK